jgi:hypothetical protein
MLLSILLAQAALRNYQGGSDSNIPQIIITLIILGALTTGGWFLWQRYIIMRFHRACAAAMNPEEQGFVKSFIARFHIKDPIGVLSHRNQFDSFMNRVAHHYENADLSEEDLFVEAKAFKEIRKKLHLKHDYHHPTLISSRALPVNHPISVSYFDSETRRRFTFESKVVINHDFFLGIQPPDLASHREISGQQKQSLQIMFIRERDAQYHFESAGVRLVDYPIPMWYIRHSSSLHRGEPHVRLSLPANLILPQDDESSLEYPVTVSTLNEEGCRFLFNDTANKLSLPSSALVNVAVGTSSLMLRGMVHSTIRRKNNEYYSLGFGELDKEQRVTIRHYLNQVREARI